MKIEFHAYVDESVKPIRDFRTLRPLADRHYVVAAITVFESDAQHLRLELQTLRNQIQVPVHYSEMNQVTRLHTLDAVSKFPDWDGYLFETSNPNTRSERHTRDKILKVALVDLAQKRGASEVTIESRNINLDEQIEVTHHGLDRHDISTLASLRSKGVLGQDLGLDHATKSEEILWLADLLASSRTDFLCHPKRLGYYARISHRVREITQVPI